ncbi:MAG: hypothetical protein U5L72_14010 [Bacteroidales bacterium]|nr:hypothetical protein [Bacteroidales bacterium]
MSEIFLLAELGIYAGFRDTSFESGGDQAYPEAQLTGSERGLAPVVIR